MTSSTLKTRFSKHMGCTQVAFLISLKNGCGWSTFISDPQYKFALMTNRKFVDYIDECSSLNQEPKIEVLKSIWDEIFPNGTKETPFWRGGKTLHVCWTNINDKISISHLNGAEYFRSLNEEMYIHNKTEDEIITNKNKWHGFTQF